MTRKLDQKEAKLVAEVNRNPRVTLLDLSKRTGMRIPEIRSRILKLQDDKLLRKLPIR